MDADPPKVKENFTAFAGMLGGTDWDCRTHDHDNLFVASSSVFPTASTMNPTLTIAALSFRIADRLREALK